MSSNQFRVRPGVPTGGQFASMSHAESVISLSDAPGRDTLNGDALARRLDRLREEGYVEPVAVAAGQDPRSSSAGSDWWATHFVTAEYGDQRGDYPQMPDDFTPKKTDGRALSGNRRTHRMDYQTADRSFALRMPSATSIKAYEQGTGGTFDIPVSASDRSGNSVSGWVRVTRSGRDWTATGLGDFGERTGAQVSEAVSSVLEARRPSRALAEVGDLLAKHRERAHAAGERFVPVRSTFISSVGYDDDEGTMAVAIRDRLYGYQVPRAAFSALTSASHPGKVYNAMVKGHTRTELGRCEQCGRFYAEGNAHTCPTGHKDRPVGPPAHNQLARAAAASIIPSQPARDLAPGPSPHPSLSGSLQNAPVVWNGTGVGYASSMAAARANAELVRGWILADSDPSDASAADPSVNARQPRTEPPPDTQVIGQAVTAQAQPQWKGTPTLRSSSDDKVAMRVVDHGPRAAAGRRFQWEAREVGPQLVNGRRGFAASMDQAQNEAEARRSQLLGAGANSGQLHSRSGAQTGSESAGRPTPEPGEHAAPPADTRSIDLAGRLTERGLRTRSSFGPQLISALGNYTSSQYVPSSYSSRGGRTLSNGYNGLIRYDGMRGSDAAAVLANLPEDQMKESKNDGPTAEAMLRAAADHPGVVEVGGFVTGADRAREQVVVESVLVYADTNLEPMAAWWRTAVRYKLHANAMPGEADLVENPWRPGEKCWRFWWD